MDLQQLRDEIDIIDKEMLSLFKKRMSVAKQIGEYKKQNNLPILNEAREGQIKKNLAYTPFEGHYFDAIFDISRRFQLNATLSKNIVLIGIMGSGKTTVGQLLAELLQLEFVDVDASIEKGENIAVNHIFDQYGEEHFRRLESEYIAKIVNNKPKIISTGGGVVKNSANMELLQKNGVTIFLNRSIQIIAAEINILSRPLLKNPSDIFDLYSERLPLYKKYADCELKGNPAPETAAKQIIRYLQKNVI